MINRAAVLGSFLLWCQLGLPDSSGLKIEYRGWLEGATETFYLPIAGEVESVVQHAPDATSTAKFCEADSDYFCISSYTLNFAIPKCLGEMQAHWQLNDIEYEILKTGQLVSLFGRTYRNLLLIRATKRPTDDTSTVAEATRILFSVESGIVGYAREFAFEPTPTFWLASEFGLGSAEVRDSACTNGR